MLKKLRSKISTISSPLNEEEKEAKQKLFPVRLLSIAIALSLFCILWSSWNAYQSYRILTNDIGESIETRDLTDRVMELDSILTYAATMAAKTGAPEWGKEYNKHVTLLDKAIATIKEKHQNLNLQHVIATEEANNKLVNMELRIFELAEKKQLSEAQNIITSTEYLENKQIYAKGMREFLQQVNKNSHEKFSAMARNMYYALYPTIAALILLVTIWFFALHSVQQWQKELEVTRKSLSERYKEKKRYAAQMQEYTDKLEESRLEQMDVNKKLEEEKAKAEHASQSKSMFLANMSHELRTPMNAVIGMADLMKDTKMDAEQNELISTIYGSARNLLAILNDILDLSKIEAEELDLENNVFDLHQVIRETTDMLRPLSNKKGLELTVNLQKNLPRFVTGDSGRLAQILKNIIGNAIKFTEDGRVDLSVTATENDVSFKVSDTGIGIAKNKIHSVFDKFSQADNLHARRYGGTGLGLAITKELVSMMNGEITLESEIAKGTTFTVTLPLEQRSDIEDIFDKMQPTAPKKKSGTSTFSQSTKILLVEDHPTNQLLMKKLLKKMNFVNIDIAEDGTEAVSACEKNSYDIILMDCQMPEMDGFEATGWIREMETTQNIHTPIIAMTANAMVGDKEKCIAAGMDDYISKPIDPVKFKDLLGKWLEADETKTQEDSSVSDGKPPPHDAPVNIEHLRNFTDGDKEEEEELFGIFFDQAELSLKNMEKSCNDNDEEEWEKSAHRFKGAAANLGAQKLSELCLTAENANADKASQEEKRNMLTSIRDEFQIVKEFLKTLH